MGNICFGARRSIALATDRPDDQYMPAPDQPERQYEVFAASPEVDVGPLFAACLIDGDGHIVSLPHLSLGNRR